MKRVKSGLIVTLLIILMSCSESEDPKSEQTDLAKVQEAITGTTWALKSAVLDIYADGKTYNYTGGSCDWSKIISDYGLEGNFYKPLLRDNRYVFGKTSLSYENMCTGLTYSNLSYTISYADFVFQIKYSDNPAVTFYLVTPIDQLNGNTIVVTNDTVYNGTTAVATLTYTISK